jgi:hypothetical protein
MTTKTTGFTLTRITVIESLGSGEVKTGSTLAEYIRGVGETNNRPIAVDLINCTDCADFRNIFKKLTSDALLGEIPIVHVECHGDQNTGLKFADGSNMPWDEVAALCLALNIACRFNLLAIYSACFGGHFLGQMGAVNPAPCWCMIAPTETVNSAEIMRGLRDFYETLIRTLDIGGAILQLSQNELTRGEWFGKAAEVWFQQLMVGYIKGHCTRAQAKRRVELLHSKLKNAGNKVNPRDLKRQIKNRNRTSLASEYFDKYFIVDKIPENAQRFSNARKRLLEEIDILRATKKYLI